MIRAVTRYVNNCDECGVDGPDNHPTRAAAEQAVCPCRTGDVLDKPPPLDVVFAPCQDIGDDPTYN